MLPERTCRECGKTIPPDAGQDFCPHCLLALGLPAGVGSASEVSTWGVGLNWYLNRNVRALFDYFDTDFGAARGSTYLRPNERVFLTRVQLAF